MLAKINTFGLLGIDAYPVAIEVDISNGLPAVNFVGLADTAIRESKERVKSAIKNSGFQWPQERITVSLAPSDIKKEGACFDLPIALGILAATQQINLEPLQNYCVLGELSLDGSLRGVSGVLPIALALKKAGAKNIILPYDNASEAAVIPEINVFALSTLKESVEFLNNPQMLAPQKVDVQKLVQQYSQYALDFSEVKGQYLAKRAIEVAVAGKHNILMVGPPGSGKTMLAKRIPTIMPDLTLEECLEITKIHSVSNARASRQGLLCTRPFRNPHHTASHIALVGGGSHPKPGEISLAHQGVLFLDELPEFNRQALEALRQPLESEVMCVSRVNRTLIFPASFMLVAALNPCPCGYYGDARRSCNCTTTRIQNYMGKISGPLLDRIDIHIELPSIKYKELADTQEAEGSRAIKERIKNSRAMQRGRFGCEGISCNAQMDARHIKKYCALNEEGRRLLKMAITELGLSARGYDKILRVSRTIADLGGCADILAEHVSEAIQYRSLDRVPGGKRQLHYTSWVGAMLKRRCGLSGNLVSPSRSLRASFLAWVKAKRPHA